jgi:molybdate transport system substrate-binding protein
MSRVKVLLGVLPFLVLSACGEGGAGRDGRELTVFAASSLTAAFTEIGNDFETANPGTTVTFNFGSSTDLAAQIESEGTADVFASASETAMDQLADDVGVTARRDFAENALVIVTPPGDPAGIERLSDLADPGVQVVLAAEGVPVGDYARQALGAVGLLDAVSANVVSNEADDASVVAKVVAGEADAAIVYESDVGGDIGDRLHAITIPDDQNVMATYPIAVIDGSTATDLARRFVEAVTGPDGRATLEAFGLRLPPMP